MDGHLSGTTTVTRAPHASATVALGLLSADEYDRLSLQERAECDEHTRDLQAKCRAEWLRTHLGQLRQELLLTL